MLAYGTGDWWKDWAVIEDYDYVAGRCQNSAIGFGDGGFGWGFRL